MPQKIGIKIIKIRKRNMIKREMKKIKSRKNYMIKNDMKKKLLLLSI